MKVGIVKYINNRYVGICSCGVTALTKVTDRYYGGERLVRDLKCENCENTFWVKLNTSEHRKVFPHLEVLNLNVRGFKVKRTNLSVWHDEDYNVYTKSNMIQVLKYDLREKRFDLYKNGETVDLGTWDIDDRLSYFFKGIDQLKFKKMVTVPENEILYNYIFSNLSNSSHYSLTKKFHVGLLKLKNHPHVEILANAGFPNLKSLCDNAVNKNGKNPQEILGLPKFMLKFLRENDNLSYYDIQRLRSATKKIDGNKFKEIMEIAKDESTIQQMCEAIDTMVEIIDNYNYTDIKKLTLYLFREIKMNQGITRPYNGATLLRDYVRMSTVMEVEYEKYPKSLKKEHDIIQMNYKVKESEHKKKEFSMAVEKEDYAKLKYKKGDYAIVTPTCIDDLIKEGSELSHCVASYVGSVVNGSCRILFLRKKDDIDTPLGTIEVRNDNIRQARGRSNRALKEDEIDFVAEWAKKKDLKLNYYR